MAIRIREIVYVPLSGTGGPINTDAGSVHAVLFDQEIRCPFLLR